jgi:D-serine deaminase-like pyridoxal phosphate-dependent protein
MPSPQLPVVVPGAEVHPVQAELGLFFLAVVIGARSLEEMLRLAFPLFSIGSTPAIKSNQNKSGSFQLHSGNHKLFYAYFLKKNTPSSHTHIFFVFLPRAS